MAAGEVNGDGYSDVFIGTSFYLNGEVGEGRVYLYPGVPPCGLTHGDATFPPVSPSRAGSWVYTGSCSSNAVLPVAGPGGTLRLYQLFCNCGGTIHVTRRGGLVHLEIR